MKIEKPIFYKKASQIPEDLEIIEVFDSSQREILKLPKFEKKIANQIKQKDIWIYYPWKNLVAHAPSEELYFLLRTTRNRNIISYEEQKAYRNLVVGICGLSVGSAILNSIVVSGGSKTLKIADFDVIELSNLNRILTSLLEAGKNKTLVAAHRAWELDPFANLHLWDKGLTAQNIRDFIVGAPRLQVFIDEMDNIDLKIKARLICKKIKIPVVMATDNGDGIILDIERFDLEPARPIFHGALSSEDIKKIGNLDYNEWLRLAKKIIGPNILSKRMEESIEAIGKTISAIPQLGSAAVMAGSAVSFVLRRIANKQTMPSGRYILSCEEKLT